MTNLNIVSQNPNSTVVAEYKSEGVRSAAYQSEAALEREFIRQLQTQAYEYLDI